MKHCRIFEPRTSGIPKRLINAADSCGVKDASYRSGRGRHVTRFIGEGEAEIDGIVISFKGYSPTGSARQIYSDGWLEVTIKEIKQGASKELIAWITSESRDIA